MPAYQGRLRQSLADAIDLTHAGDESLALAYSVQGLHGIWHVSRVELLYELAYLRLFGQWEAFLEETFLRYLCGYSSRYGIAALAGGGYCKDLGVARSRLFGTGGFVLWHNPNTVIKRSAQFFAGSRHEYAISASAAALTNFAAIRHRIAHSQEDARQKFDDATMRLVGRRYRGSRPGRFLRGWDKRKLPQTRWLVSIGNELVSIAGQVI